MTIPRIVFHGDSALNVEFEDRIDPVINAHAIALSEAIGFARHPGVRDIVPTNRSLTVHFDPLRTDVARLLGAFNDWTRTEHEPRAERAPIEVPVVYGGPWGPDLGAVAEFARCSPDEVVRLHASREYRVYMLGFQPGFPYMGMVDPRIAVPRHATPRLHVAAGSGRHRPHAGEHLPAGFPGWLAHHRAHAGEDLRPGAPRAVPAETGRRGQVRSRRAVP